jgi:pseudaminic acid biosynthesis-associated methylase
MNKTITDQEAFWAGEFGDEYAARNKGADLLASNTAFFARALHPTQPIASLLELGANIGMNLQALRLLFPQTEFHAVEINAKACVELRKLPDVSVVNSSILEYLPARTFDLVLIKGVLIHLDPQVLSQAYDIIFKASHRYVLLTEYYSPSPVEVSYRGHRDRLFKRDFAGELMARHPELVLLDYGFRYRGDPKWPQDDTTWFLLEKK